MPVDKSPARNPGSNSVFRLGGIFARARRAAPAAAQCAVTRTHDGREGSTPPLKLVTDPFVSRARREVKRAERSRCGLSLVLFGIDRGTSGAATQLAGIAACVRRNMRETDACAALGDSLIAVLLIETDARGASAYLHKIQRELPLPGVATRVETYPSAAFDELCAGRVGARLLNGMAYRPAPG